MTGEFEYVRGLLEQNILTPGKWISVVGEELIAEGNSGKEVFDKAKKKYPTRTPFVMKIPVHANRLGV